MAGCRDVVVDRVAALVECLAMTQETVLLDQLRTGHKTTNALCAVHVVTPEGKHISLSRELTRIVSTLRRKKYDIVYTYGKGGTGFYTLMSEPPVYQLEPSGQYCLA